MNNSDYNDFKNWQNGDDENEMNNPNNGFFYFGPTSPHFKNLWNKINNKEDYIEDMKSYLNMDDIMKQWNDSINEKMKQQPKKYPKQKQKSIVTLTHDEYMKLIEIRGYLAITEQLAHVKALDKLLNQIVMVPKDTK